MSENTEALAEIIRREHARAIFRQRPEDCWDAAADAVLAAGYRKPRTIDNFDELDDLPVGTVLLDRDGDVVQRFRGGWRATINEIGGDPWLSDTLEVDLPATVLHEGVTK